MRFGSPVIHFICLKYKIQWKWKWSHSVGSDSLRPHQGWTVPHQAPLSMGFSRQKYWVAISFSRGIFPMQGSNPSLLHCRQTLYHRSHLATINFGIFIIPIRNTIPTSSPSSSCLSFPHPTTSAALINFLYRYIRTSLMVQMIKNLPAMQETWVWSLCWEDILEEGMASHSSILAWRIPWREGPGGLQFMGLQRVGHDWVTKHSTQI